MHKCSENPRTIHRRKNQIICACSWNLQSFSIFHLLDTPTINRGHWLLNVKSTEKKETNKKTHQLFGETKTEKKGENSMKCARISNLWGVFNISRAKIFSASNEDVERNGAQTIGSDSRRRRRWWTLPRESVTTHRVTEPRTRTPNLAPAGPLTINRLWRRKTMGAGTLRLGSVWVS